MGSAVVPGRMTLLLTPGRDGELVVRAADVQRVLPSVRDCIVASIDGILVDTEGFFPNGEIATSLEADATYPVPVSVVPAYAFP